MASVLTHYPVSLAAYLGARGDHHAIYVHLNKGSKEGLKGYLFHVIGSLQSGMALEVREEPHPFDTPTGDSVQQVGWVSHDMFVDIERICKTIPPPEKQWLGAKLLVRKTEIRHCQHWAAEAIDALRKEGILEPLGPSDNGAIIMRKVEKVAE